jgi:hypothetical protein
MNQRLTCDEVFDHLTRAPFPAGATTDQCVDEHLRVCHDCRQMAEALRPATDLFREALSEDQRRRLPAYRGQLATITRDRQAAPATGWSLSEFTSWNPVSCAGTSRQPQRYFLPALGLALLLLVAMLQGRGMIGDSANSNSPLTAGNAGSDHTRTCSLAGFALPRDCLPQSIVGPVRPKPTEPSVKPPSNDAHQLMACMNCHETVRAVAEVCCTNCHAANLQGKPGKTLFPRLATSCARCHNTSVKRLGPRASG